MSARAVLLAAFVVAGLAPASAADRMTSQVYSFDAKSRSIVLGDRSVLTSIPASVELPADLKPGDTLDIEFESSENGVDKVLSVKRRG